MLDKSIEQLFVSPESGPVDAAAILFSSPQKNQPAHPEWLDEQTEGQLAVDIFETATELVIVAPMAGTEPRNIELHLQNDCLTIRGGRERPIAETVRSYHEECFWGAFSRTIVLPVDVQAELARSEYKQGILTIRLPKMTASKTIPILVIEE